jgi:hypothetical protein
VRRPWPALGSSRNKQNTNVTHLMLWPSETDAAQKTMNRIFTVSRTHISGQCIYLFVHGKGRCWSFAVGINFGVIVCCRYQQ